MGLEAKHSYRFVYLRSEKWDSVRLEALANYSATCFVCGYQSISNDAHHICYPESYWDTKADDLVILCRACHNFMHRLEGLNLVKFKKDKLLAISKFLEICKSVKLWKEECNWCGGYEFDGMASKHEKRIRAVNSNCYTCGGASADVCRRQFSGTGASPDKIGARFCNDCFRKLDKELQFCGLDISSAPKVHIAIRKIMKSRPDLITQY